MTTPDQPKPNSNPENQSGKMQNLRTTLEEQWQSDTEQDEEDDTKKLQGITRFCKP